MYLGENIRYLRTKQGYSQEYIAEKLGYKSFTTIQKWESGVSEPPVKKLKELSDLLGVDMDDMNNRRLSIASENEPVYYLNEETRKIAQEVYDNPELKILFDATRNCSKEDMQLVIDMAKRLKGDR